MTHAAPRQARAPGKLVFLGEYAVVRGAPAIVAAVDRYASARAVVSPDGRWQLHADNLDTPPVAIDPDDHAVPAGPLSLAASLMQVLAGDQVLDDAQPSHIFLNSSDLFVEGGKLGLGSSAAVLAALHRLLDATAQPTRAFARIDRAHRAGQRGLGSGVDVAAAVAGGVTVFQRGSPVRIARATLPDALQWAAIYTGVSASTGGFLARMAEYERTQNAAFLGHMNELDALAQAGVAALIAHNAGDFCDIAGRYGRALAALGEAAGVAIESPEHRALASCARRAGVHYKVSGAGGGDVGLAFSTDMAALDDFRTRASEVSARFRPLSLGLAPAVSQVEKKRS